MAVNFNNWENAEKLVGNSTFIDDLLALNPEATEVDMQPFMQAILSMTRRGLQHVIDNAETVPSGEGLQ